MSEDNIERPQVSDYLDDKETTGDYKQLSKKEQAIFTEF